MKNEQYQKNGKNSIILPIFKKDDKLMVDNYSEVNLSICRKFLFRMSKLDSKLDDPALLTHYEVC